MWSVSRLQERICSLFYLHGLFCASHPLAILCLVILTVFSLCLPLARLPIPTNAPEHFTTPSRGYKPPSVLATLPHQQTTEADKQPRWYFGKPVGYVQQIVVESVVSPWDHQQLIPSDAYRGPIATSFDIVDLVNRLSHREGDQTVSLHDLCFHVSEPALDKTVRQRLRDKGLKLLLPEYGCLMVSPANLWNNQKQEYTADRDVIRRVFDNFGPPLDTPPSIKDILFGVPWKDTGLKRYFIRNRERAISYAVTIVMSKYDAKYLEALEEQLHNLFPESVPSNASEAPRDLVHMHFKGINYIAEYTPLLVTYALLFMYIYFSVSKIEMVKSKWGLALAAVITVIASLLISVSICFFFGMTPSLSGSEIFPYLVVIIGLENNLVITKSVVSTPVHLDVKLRVAKGLSKEGWYIFKNMTLELGVLAFGFISMVPAIQEFCLFAFVGLVSDTFLQMFFFTTVVAIDIKRMELTDIHRQGLMSESSQQSTTPSLPVPRVCPVMARFTTTRTPQPPKLPRNPSSLGLNRIAAATAGYRAKPASISGRSPSLEAVGRDDSMFREAGDELNPDGRHTPRRVKLLNFWARTRIIQRAIMASVVLWVLLFVYKTSLVDDLNEGNNTSIHVTSSEHKPTTRNVDKLPAKIMQYAHNSQPNVEAYEKKMSRHMEGSEKENFVEGGQKWLQSFMTEEHSEKWKRLAHGHWPTLLGYYNISLGGRYITILPTIHVSNTLNIQDALQMRHALATSSPAHQTYNWKPEEDLPTSPNQSSPLDLVMQRLTRVPRTKLELVATVLFVVANLVILTFTVIYLYKCMCSRNYAKWRTSWQKSRKGKKGATYYKKIRESLPIVLRGHNQEVECLCMDGPLVVSSCLGGHIRVWDSSSGECVTHIDRKHITPMPPQSNREPAAGRNMDDSEADLYAEYHEPNSIKFDFPSHYSGSGGCVGPPPPHNSPPTPGPSPGRSTLQFDFSQANYNSSPGMNSQTIYNSVSETVYSPPSCVSRQDICPKTNYSNVSGSSPPTDYSIVSGPGTSPHYMGNTAPQGVYTGNQGYNTMPTTQGQFGGTSGLSASPPAPPCGVRTSSSTERLHSSNMHITRRSSHTRHRSADINMADFLPDLSETIDTDFQGARQGSHKHGSSTQDATPSSSAPYDFSQFDACYDNHRQLMSERQRYEMRKRSSAEYNGGSMEIEERDSRRTWSMGSNPYDDDESSLFVNESSLLDSLENAPALWCMTCKDNLIITGCGNGRIEFWDGLSGVLKYIHQHNSLGVTNICFVGHKVIAARLDGSIDFLELETFINSNKPSLPPTRSPHIHNRGHVRQPSNPSLADLKSWDDIIHVTLLTSSHAHQQPINKLIAESSRVVSASQDHTLKVFRLEDSLCLYTLHGHLASVTALFLDQVAPLAAASGSEDGDVRVWDMLTGACVHKLQGHVNTVTTITCTPVYVISTGMDDRLCVWERCKGTLLHWIQMEAGFCNSVAMLTSNLMVTGGQGRLYLWDVPKGEVLRAVSLGDYDCSVFVNQLVVIGNSAVICDYGNQICVIHFPSVLEKSD